MTWKIKFFAASLIAISTACKTLPTDKSSVERTPASNAGTTLPSSLAAIGNQDDSDSASMNLALTAPSDRGILCESTRMQFSLDHARSSCEGEIGMCINSYFNTVCQPAGRTGVKGIRTDMRPQPFCDCQLGSESFEGGSPVTMWRCEARVFVFCTPSDYGFFDPETPNPPPPVPWWLDIGPPEKWWWEDLIQ